jgi:hypothetical protein
MDLYLKEAGLLGPVYLETIEKEQEKYVCVLGSVFSGKIYSTILK